jgi:hypothetical protein
MFMKVKDLIKFKNNLFFDGAVQLSWLDNEPELAFEAARSYVFHGSDYHGVNESDITEGIGRYLKSTTQFVKEVVVDVTGNEDNFEHNPFHIAIAGYGTGKSHLAITVANLLKDCSSEVSKQILFNFLNTDQSNYKAIEESLHNKEKPNLIISFDGMGNFELSNHFYKKALKQLKLYNLDYSVIEALSPRFQIALDFIENHFENDRQLIERIFGNDFQIEEIKERLEEREESTYYRVDTAFFKVFNKHIPDEGEESPQHLISSICNEYCGDSKPFGALVIIFDEFGRYLEYVASKSHLADDSALQQIFQGVQDNKSLCTFLGFIQYDLQAYLNRIKSKETPTLLRYVTRYDTAKKSYLSSNLETIFAHLIEKKEISQIEALTDKNGSYWQEVHSRVNEWFPHAKNISIWNNFDDFMRVIVNGCWPIHPLTIWFFARQQNILQNRSAISFVRDELNRIYSQSSNKASLNITDVFHGGLFEQIVMSEKAQFGSIAQDYSTIVEQKNIGEEEQQVLLSIVVANKLKAKTKDRLSANSFIELSAGLKSKDANKIIANLSENLNVLEWNKDTGQYDLITDAVPKSHFTSFLRRKAAKLDPDISKGLFNTSAKSLYNSQDGIGDFRFNFDKDKKISTPEWSYTSYCTTEDDIKETIRVCTQRWKDSLYPDENQSRGSVVYYFISSEAIYSKSVKHLENTISAEQGEGDVEQIPIFFVLIQDQHGEIEHLLKRHHVLNKQLSDEEKTKYGHFIGPEQVSIQEEFEAKIDAALKKQEYVFPDYFKSSELNKLRRKQIGDLLFNLVYPDIIEFPFDGFSTMRGVAAKDCSEMTRSLALGKLNDDWIRSKDTKLQNRAIGLLVKTWKFINESGELSPVTGHSGLNRIIGEIDQQLKESKQLSLYELTLSLIRPPYGFNLASGGLVIAYFLGKTTPAKQLNFNGEDLGVSDWIQRVFDKNFFDLDLLKLSIINYVTDDVVSQWEELLNEWDFEKYHSKIYNYANKAEEKQKACKIPEKFLERLKRLKQKADISFNIISKRDYELKKLEDRIDSANRKEDVNHLTYCSKLLVDLKNVMKNEDCWLDHELEDIVQLVSSCNDRLTDDSFFNPWLKSQHCHDAKKLSDFRHKMVDQTANNLADVGLNDLSIKVKDHYRSIADNIDEAQKSKTVIEDSLSFLKLRKARETSSIQELDDWIEQANELLDTLGKTKVTAGKEKIKELFENIGIKKEEFIEKKSIQTSRLNDLTNTEISSLQQIVLLLEELKRLHAIFSGKKDDLEYISDIEKQLLLFHEDISQWNIFEGASENLESIAKEKIKQRLATEEENEEDYIWDSKQVYEFMIEAILKEKKQKSKDWLESTIGKKPNLNSYQEIRDVDNLLDQINIYPTFISKEHQKILEEFNNKLKLHKKRLQEKVLSENAKQWIGENVLSTSEINKLTYEQTNLVLNKLATVPSFLSEKDVSKVAQCRKLIMFHQDKLDFDSILQRLINLSSEKKIHIIKTLEENLKKEVAEKV